MESTRFIDKNRFAYVFYATEDKYAVAACVAVKHLQRTNIGPDIDIVVLHLPISKYILNTMRKMNMITVKVDALHYYRDNDYFKDCLIKLRLFQLTQYERVVYMDADTIPLKNMDHLFSQPFNGTIAAPRAYWLQKSFVSSMLLVVKPSLSLWNRAERHFGNALEKQFYDMDIINIEFKDEIYVLPDEYGCLNSEWEDKNTAYHFGDPEKTFNQIKIVHFSALGKPWSYHPDTISLLRPNSHPIFHLLWEKWWISREQIFKESSFGNRLKFNCHRYFQQEQSMTWLKRFKKRLWGQNCPT